jgi:hypothetical protein
VRLVLWLTSVWDQVKTTSIVLFVVVESSTNEISCNQETKAIHKQFDEHSMGPQRGICIFTNLHQEKDANARHTAATATSAVASITGRCTRSLLSSAI